MGQYYKPINLNSKEWLYTHDYGSGLKLMEHSWMKNPLVQAVETLLMPEHKWHKSPIVWAGDYADGELDEQGNPLMERWTDDSGKEREAEINLYSQCDDEYKLYPREREVPKEFKYIVNHTKKEYVNKDSVPNNDGWRIHPLPVLTCEGNGRGGGDLHPERANGDFSLVGRWARDVISVESKQPRGYKKLNFDLIEMW